MEMEPLVIAEEKVCPFTSTEVADKVIELASMLSGMPYYPYQREPARAICISIIDNLADEITICQSRQSGKTTMLASVIGALLILLPELAKMFPDDQRLNRVDDHGIYRGFKDGFQMGLFAPIKEQADIAYSRMRGYFEREETQAILKQLKIGYIKANGNTVHLTNGSSIKSLSASEHSHVEGHTFHTLLLEECLVGETEVETPDGLMKIQDLVETQYAGKVRGFVVGAICWVDVSKVWKIPTTEKRGYRVTFSNGSSIVCTKGHAWAVSNFGYMTAELLYRVLDFVHNTVSKMHKGEVLHGTDAFGHATWGWQSDLAYAGESNAEVHGKSLPKAVQIRCFEGSETEVSTGKTRREKKSRFGGVLVSRREWMQERATSILETLLQGKKEDCQPRMAKPVDPRRSGVVVHGRRQRATKIRIPTHAGVFKKGKLSNQKVLSRTLEDISVRYEGTPVISEALVLSQISEGGNLPISRTHTTLHTFVDALQAANPAFIQNMRRLQQEVRSANKHKDMLKEVSSNGEESIQEGVSAKNPCETKAHALLGVQKELHAVPFEESSENKAAWVFQEVQETNPVVQQQQFSAENARGAEVPLALVGIEEVALPEFVYDLTTSSGNFFAEGVLCHNSQEIGDAKIRKSLRPTVAATNGTIVFIGTPAPRRCEFYYAIQRNRRSELVGARKKNFEYDYMVCEQYNSMYKKFIAQEKERIGEDSDEFRMSYKIEWILERGMFVTPEKLRTLEVNDDNFKTFWEGTRRFPQQHHTVVHSAWSRNGPLVAGIDFGKMHDSTVITILDVDWAHPMVHIQAMTTEESVEFITFNKSIIAWKEMYGDDYESQFHQIKDYLGNFPQIGRMVLDATGVGESLTDRFTATYEDIDVVPFKFTPQSKSEGFKLLASEISSRRLTFPASAQAKATLEYRKFVTQMVDLEKDYRKGTDGVMVCQAPDEKDSHDDFPCSGMLACWGCQSPIYGGVETSDDNPFLR